jgi:hypothetical protein
MRVESEETVIPAKGVRSLVWSGNSLVDWVSGGVRYELDGTRESARRSIGYRFDAALVSRSGAHVAIYERLGTKGLLVSAADCTLLRELNRSYYFADAYEFPTAGTLLGVDDDLVLSLFDHPKLIRISDGAVVGEWRHLSTGQQNSSIIRHVGRIPPFALHRTERMFAVADDEKITVVRCLTTP